MMWIFSNICIMFTHTKVTHSPHPQIPPSGQLAVVILQISLEEAAAAPLTTSSVADRRAPTLLVLQLG